MPVQVTMKTWVRWAEVAGTPDTTPDVYQAILAKYRRSSLLMACASLSIALKLGVDGETAVEDERVKLWIPVLFPQTVIGKMQELRAAGRIIFFQAQIRYLANEVRRLPQIAEDGLPPIENYELGELLLRAAEMVFEPQEKLSNPLDSLAAEVAQWLPIYEIDSSTDPFYPLMRFYIFLTVNIGRIKESDRTFDVDAEFQKVYPFSLVTFCEFMFTLLTHAVTKRDNHSGYQLIDPSLGVSWFKNTNVDPNLVLDVFNSVGFTLESPVAGTKRIGYADFEPLKRTPYFLFEEAIYCLDYDFALGKLESNSLWAVLASMSKERGNAYLGFWGYVFEDYVSWILETYAHPKKNVVYKSPVYEDGANEEICDVVVICGSAAVLIEAKLATCPVGIRYSGDHATMKAFLEDKLVTGSDRAAAVTQLVRTIHKLATADEATIPRWLRNIRKFIPLVVTRDEIGSCWGLNGYLNTRYEEMIDRKACKGYSITPIVSMNVSTLERAGFALAKMELAKILEDRIQNDQQLRRPFEAASKYVHRGTPRNLTAHLAALGELKDRTVADFGIVEG
jgi:hypothetical protein